MHIREALVSEAPKLTELAIRSKAYWGYSSQFMEACREELTVVPDKVASHSYLYAVAERNGEVMGFYALERMSDGNLELEALFVEPDYIGSGVGRALINHAIRSAADTGGERLIVQGDPNAAQFYQAAGGRLVGRRESGSIPGRFLPVYSIPLRTGDL